MMNNELAYEVPTFLPGRLRLARGGPGDYAELARFHYRAGTPATFAETWAVHFIPHESTEPGAPKREAKLSKNDKVFPNAPMNPSVRA